MAIRIHPSILNSNLANLSAEINRIPSADGIHLDVMDNHFVPNLSFGLPMVESVRKNHPGRFLDTHLMIEDPDRWAPAYADAGSEIVTFQAEASLAPTRLARELRSRGAKAGMALRPQTAIEPFEDILGELDLILVMTVDPGFGGQPFLESMLPKIERTRKLIDKHGLDIWLQVDGGVTDETIGRCVDAGADVFVAGSVVFRAEEPDSVVRSLRQRAEQR